MSSDTQNPTRRQGHRWLFVFAVVLVAWFAFCEIATEVWYRWNESRSPVTSAWSVDLPNAEQAAAAGIANFNTREMTDTERELLRYETAKTASWRGESGAMWTGFLMNWPHDKRLNQSDINHNPTACLPAVGLEMVRERDPITITRGKDVYRFRAWEFELKGRPVYVYLAVRRDRDVADPTYTRDKMGRYFAFFTRAWKGLRGNPLQVLELVVIGPGDAETADRALENQLAALSAFSSGSETL